MLSASLCHSPFLEVTAIGQRGGSTKIAERFLAA